MVIEDALVKGTPVSCRTGAACQDTPPTACRFRPVSFDVVMGPRPRTTQSPTQSVRDTTMRYMMFIKHPRDYEGLQPPPSLYAAMGEFVGEQIAKGVFIDGAGLQPLAKATRVRLTHGKITVTDGPFSEAKEIVGGYSLIEAATHAEAVALATRFMELHRTHWPAFEGESEIRPLEDMGDPPQG